MEQKIMEKRAMLEVVEAVNNALTGRWTMQEKQEAIAAWKEEQATAKANGEEADPEGWVARRAKEAEAYLAAVETVMKHIEKLI